MINTLSILFSLIGVAFIVVRAMMLDRMMPWFKPIPPELARRGVLARRPPARQIPRR